MKETKFNVIEEAGKMLRREIASDAEGLAKYALEERSYMYGVYLDSIKINKFLLNLVSAYNINITKYLPKEKEEKKKDEEN